MSDFPRGTSGPPFSGPRLGDERPMSVLGGVAWTVVVTLVFLWLLIALVALRPASRVDLVSACGCQLAAYLLGLFGILQSHAPRASIREFIGLRRTHALFYPLAAALGVALAGPITAVYQVIERRWPSSGTAEAEMIQELAEAGTGMRAAIGLAVVVLGPATEELFFRGALTRPLRRRYGTVAVAAVTALLFAVVHMEPRKLLPIGLFGLALGALRAQSGSIVPPLLAHAAYNGVSLSQIYAAAGQIAAEGGAPDVAAERVRRLEVDAPMTPWLLVVSTVAALGLMALARFVGGRAEAATRARERDTA